MPKTVHGVDMIMREKHGNRLSVLALDHLEPGVVSLTIIPRAGGNLSIYGANFDMSVEQQVALIEALLANLNHHATTTMDDVLSRYCPLTQRSPDENRSL